MAKKQPSKTEKQNEQLHCANYLLKQELEKVRIEGKMSLDAESRRADINETAARHNADVASKIAEDLKTERVGRRAILESLRRERLQLVSALYVVDQRLQAMLETERGCNGALLSATGQVENEDGDPLTGQAHGYDFSFDR